MHQKSKRERWFGDTLLAMVLYSHFQSEHLLVHHRYVATPRDPVTARYGEGFHRFFPRVLRECWHSAFNAEKAMLARKDLPWTELSNPFLDIGRFKLDSCYWPACLVASLVLPYSFSKLSWRSGS